jgi:hypothetical protein
MIHVVHPDVRRYQTYVLDGKEIRNKLGADTMFHFDQRPIPYAGHWQPMEISFAQVGSAKTAALPDLMIRHGRLFLNLRARDALQGLLDACGEWLPVTYGDAQGYLFNVLAVVDELGGLDRKLCIKNSYGDVQSLGFHEDLVKPFVVFRTAYDAYTGVYCQEEFRHAVAAAGLAGVTFSIDLAAVAPMDHEAKVPVRH